MNEADVIGGMLALPGMLLCAIALFSHHQMVTRERFWGGVFRGWRTKDQAPTLYALNRVGNVLSGIFGAGLLLFGLWIMTQ